MTELGLFARHWTPGAVKTRLAAEIGNEQAARIYQASLEVTVTRLGAVGQRRTIAFTPDTQRGAFERLAGTNWGLRAQYGSDLGERMHAYFDAAFDDGAQRVVLIGSDSPTLPVGYVEQTFTALQCSSVVLGPAEDGGYYLVGLSAPLPELFHQIEWSTPQVWSQTLERLRQLAIGYETLPPWHDFDELADVQRLQQEVSELGTRDEVFRPLQRAIDDALASRKYR